MIQIAAGKFKSRCLKLMSNVQKTHQELVVTKFGKPLVKVVPVEEKPKRPLFGYLKEKILIKEDIVKPIGEKWEADA